MNSQLAFPDVWRTDSGIALVSTLYVGTPAEQRAEAKRVTAVYREQPLPTGFISFSTFGSTDGETLLTYAQWANDETYRQFARTLDPSKDEIRTEPTRFVPYRSSVLDHHANPGVLVVPTFDVDGPDRQRKPVDALVDGPLSKLIPGLFASHFHVSLDGSRVLNWAEWADEAAHDDFMQTSLPAECFEAITMPGVRGIGGKRYTPLESVSITLPGPHGTNVDGQS
jgi:methylaspartate ammonia-lyase